MVAKKQKQKQSYFTKLNVLRALMVLALVVGGVFAYKAYAQTSVVTLLNARTTTGGCTALNASQFAGLRAVHASGTTSAGSGAAEVEVRGGMSSANVSVVLATLTLTLSTSGTAAAGNAGAALYANWPFVCANVNSISGTGAAVTVTMGAS